MSYVIDALTNRKINKREAYRVIVQFDENHLEYGYVKNHIGLPYYKYNGLKYPIIMNMPDVIFCKRTGEYVVNTNDIDNYDVEVYGNGRFPYSIDREYGAEKHIKLFEAQKSSVDSTQHLYAKHLKYSFGLEFETAAGFIPEKECMRLGLIPLRDGSITGVEYSTIPMQGNEGLNRLKAQLDCLKEYTIPNKECSVHIHFGGFPINKKTIFALHQLWSRKYQYLLTDYIPRYSYDTNYFKQNGKSYCNRTRDCFNSFNEMYRYYVGTNFLGDLYQPHPNDIEKRAKWNIKTRYYNCNFINLLCYKNPKTVEFRFLTPTYSFEKLSTFIMILNAILIEAENLSKGALEQDINYLVDNHRGDIPNLLDKVYDDGVCEKLSKNLDKLIYLKATQDNCNDLCGARLDIEYKYFPDGQ